MVLAGRYQLIFMDMQMPIMDGYEATRVLGECGYKTLIIARSASAMKQHVQESLSAGCTEHLAKPFERHHFYKIIDKYLNKVENPQESKMMEQDREIEESEEYQAIVNRFVSELNEKLINLESALTNQAWELLCSISHNLYSAGLYRFEEFGQLNQALQRAAEERNQPQAEAYVKSVLQPGAALKQAH
ncbi:MAG: response regulator [Deltaproteobacteria bacterium]|nr:response regulator [Deltaproteobacteria bacterium]